MFDSKIFLGTNNDIWVGGTMTSGQWKWTDSTEFIYTNWRDGKTPLEESKG